jgi:alkylation response protein AidB-like acyl-CoA dehydrogenase
MNFLLSEEQKAMQEALARVLADRCDSRSLHALIDAKGDLDTELWRLLADQGMTGIGIAEAHGGLGLGVVDLALASEMLGRAAAPVPLHGHWLAAHAIGQSTDAAQKARWLPDLASGRKIATVAFAEDGARWMPDAWTLEGGKSLSGVKRFAPCAASADIAVVGLKGGELAVVDLHGAGVRIEALAGIDRTRPMGDLHFENAACERLAAPAGAAERTFNAGLAIIAADAFGGASRCLDMAVEYAKVREQFGRKIGGFQALRHQLANLANEVEPCRGMYWFGAYAQDSDPAQATHAASLAKAHVGQRYLEAARSALEYHGGIGFTWEYDSHIWLKRAMLDQSWLGNADAHYLRAADHAGW